MVWETTQGSFEKTQGQFPVRTHINNQGFGEADLLFIFHVTLLLKSLKQMQVQFNWIIHFVLPLHCI